MWVLRRPGPFAAAECAKRNHTDAAELFRLVQTNKEAVDTVPPFCSGLTEFRRRIRAQ